jgi:hypothetical protein
MPLVNWCSWSATHAWLYPPLLQWLREERNWVGTHKSVSWCHGLWQWFSIGVLRGVEIDKNTRGLKGFRQVQASQRIITLCFVFWCIRIYWVWDPLPLLFICIKPGGQESAADTVAALRNELDAKSESAERITWERSHEKKLTNYIPDFSWCSSSNWAMSS